MNERILKLQEKMYEVGDVLAEGILNGEIPTSFCDEPSTRLLFVNAMYGKDGVSITVEIHEQQMFRSWSGVLFRDNISKKLAQHLLAKYKEQKEVKLQERITEMQNELHKLQTKKAS